MGEIFDTEPRNNVFKGHKLVSKPNVRCKTICTGDALSANLVNFPNNVESPNLKDWPTIPQTAL